MNRENILNKTPEKPGVYQLKSFGKLVYIGSSKNIRSRLLTHYQERNPNAFRFKTAGLFRSHKKLEKRHLKKYKRKNGRLPDWNAKMV